LEKFLKKRLKVCERVSINIVLGTFST